MDNLLKAYAFEENCQFHLFPTGDVKMVEFLLDNGANLNMMDGHKQTALHWAIYYGELYI